MFYWYWYEPIMLRLSVDFRLDCLVAAIDVIVLELSVSRGMVPFPLKGKICMVNPHLLLNNSAWQKYRYTSVPIETSVRKYSTVPSQKEGTFDRDQAQSHEVLSYSLMYDLHVNNGVFIPYSRLISFINNDPSHSIPFQVLLHMQEIFLFLSVHRNRSYCFYLLSSSNFFGTKGIFYYLVNLLHIWGTVTFFIQTFFIRNKVYT